MPSSFALKRLRDIRPKGGERILVVDENPDHRELIAKFLTENGFDLQFTFTSSAEDALALSATQDFDCVIADYRLPGMNGADLTTALHAADKDAEVPVVMLASSGTESTVVDALHSGVADYLSKDSLTPTAARRAVFTAITHSRLTSEVAAKTRHLEETNLKLQRQHRELRSVYHTISHEIKTPLTAAREFASLIADKVLGDTNEQQREALENIIVCCDQLKVHFDDLLDFSRTNSGKMQMRPERTEIQPLVRRAVASVSRQANEKRINIRLEMNDEFPEMHIDGNRVVQVLGNLLTNAVNFTDEGGRITTIVTPVESPAPGIRIDVSDNGCGIPQNCLPHIFESLYQVRTSDTSTHEGLGLGLSIARSIVELHGGEINVQSSVAVGSTFSVFLPRKPIAPEQTGKYAVLNVSPDVDIETEPA